MNIILIKKIAFETSMQQIYMIRKVCFSHNDLENVRVGLGDIIGVFDEYDQAYKAYLTCERYAHQHNHISNFELTQREGEELLAKMQYFFLQHFPQIADFQDIRDIPVLPTEATLIQTAEFIKLAGLQHYDLSAHEQISTYYKIKMADDFWGEEEDFTFSVFPHEVRALYFLQESQEEAVQGALEVGYSYLWHDRLEETDYHFAGLQGKLTNLSKTPDVLEDYLQSCENLWYDDKKQKIQLSPEVEEAETASVLEELRGLFSLLVRKPFFITPIDLDSMKNKMPTCFFNIAP